MGRRSPEHKAIAEELGAFGVTRKRIHSLFVGKKFNSVHQGQNPQHQDVLTISGQSDQGPITITITKKAFVKIDPKTGTRTNAVELDFKRRHPRDRWKT